jgi:hypothetical protein
MRLLDEFVTWSGKELELLERGLALLEQQFGSAGELPADHPLRAEAASLIQVCRSQIAGLERLIGRLENEQDPRLS